MMRSSFKNTQRGFWPSPFNRIPAEGWPALAIGDALSRDVVKAGNIRVYCCTWNMHGKVCTRSGAVRVDVLICAARAPPSLPAQPPPADIDVLVPFNLYHVYVFCTQECLNSIAKSIVFTSKAPWEQKLQDCVGDDYVMLRRCAECCPLRGI